MPPGQLHSGEDGLLGADVAGVRLVDADGVVGRTHRREPGPDLDGIEDLVRQSVQHRCLEAARDHGVVRVAEVEPAAQPHEVAPRLLLQLAPALEGSLEERHVAGPLEVGLADDPAAAVGRAPVVGGPERLQPEDPQATGGQGVHGGRPHRPHADDDHVVAGSAGHGAWVIADETAPRPEAADMSSSCPTARTHGGSVVAVALSDLLYAAYERRLSRRLSRETLPAPRRRHAGRQPALGQGPRPRHQGRPPGRGRQHRRVPATGARRPGSRSSPCGCSRPTTSAGRPPRSCPCCRSSRPP